MGPGKSYVYECIYVLCVYASVFVFALSDFKKVLSIRLIPPRQDSGPTFSDTASPPILFFCPPQVPAIGTFFPRRPKRPRARSHSTSDETTRRPRDRSHIRITAATQAIDVAHRIQSCRPPRRSAPRSRWPRCRPPSAPATAARTPLASAASAAPRRGSARRLPSAWTARASPSTAWVLPRTLDIYMLGTGTDAQKVAKSSARYLVRAAAADLLRICTVLHLPQGLVEEILAPLYVCVRGAEYTRREAASCVLC